MHRRSSQTINGTPGNSNSFDELHELIKAQAFRLAHWRVAIDDINYRRFFDINDLAALRMQDQAVFDATHRLVFEWMQQDKVDGLRIDHPDGLYDPAQYFQRLQASFTALTPCEEPSNAKTCRFLAIEKILTGGEELAQLAGQRHQRLRLHQSGERTCLSIPAAATKMEAGYRAFLGEKLDFDDDRLQRQASDHPLSPGQRIQRAGQSDDAASRWPRRQPATSP